MKQPRFEITRQIDDEELFLDALDQYGFEIVKNYASLPENYRIQFKDPTRTKEEGLQILGDHFPFCEYDPLDSDEVIVKGAGFGYYPEPLNTWRYGFGLSGLPDWTDVYGHHWGVLAQVTDNTDVLFTNMHHLSRKVWDINFQKKGNGVNYLIMDTGVDRRHPVFDEWPYGNRVEWAAGGDDFYQTGTDDQNHGTGMASCGAGKGLGVAEMSRIVAVKGLDGNNAGASSALLDGWDALIAWHNAQDRPSVMNNSWSSDSSTAFNAASQACVNAGIVMVASAGNAYGSIQWPAAHDNILAIGALDLNMVPADFTNYGSGIWWWSAGRQIRQGWRGGSGGWASGTSPAGGFAAGIICALLEGYEKPTTLAQVQTINNWLLNNHSKDLRQAFSSKYDDSSNRVLTMPKGNDSTAPAGLKKLVSMKRDRLGGGCITRSRVRLGGLQVNALEYIHPLVNQQKISLALSKPSPTDSVVYSATIQKGNWRMRNQDWANTSNAAGADFPRSVEMNFNDPDGSASTIQNRPEANLAWDGGIRGQSRMEQILPPDLTAESNPKFLDEIFTNIDFDDQLTGWTAGNPANISARSTANEMLAYSGFYFPEAVNGTDNHLLQVGTIGSEWDGIIDAGRAKLFLSYAFIYTGLFTSGNPDDQAQVRVYAVNAADADISTVYDSGVVNRTQVAQTGIDRGVHGNVILPALTRKLRIRIDFYFNAGSILNTTVDGLAGCIYEQTDQGDRILEEIERGNAYLDHTYVRRSWGIDSDDQGRPLIEFFNAGSPLPNIIDTMAVEYTSPHNWTKDRNLHKIPKGTSAINFGMEGNLRAGSAINYYHRDHTLDVVVGQRSRRFVAKSRAVVRSKPITRNVAGFDIASAGISRQ